MQLVWFIFFIMIGSFGLSGIIIFASHQIQILYLGHIYNSRHLGHIYNSRPIMFVLINFFWISMIMGGILSFGFSKHFLLPIQKLIQATEEVAKGNYHVRVTTEDGERELGRLMKSFNHMVQELESVELLKTDFINYFSHEFKTPIISIRGFAKQLQQEQLSAEQRQEFAEIIYKESERLVKLSTNVLLLTRLENQTLVKDKSYFSLDEQLRHCILLLQEEWEKKNLELDLSLEEIQYFGNEEMLSQVWINLIGNGIKYSNENGKLIIKCSKMGKKIKVRIEDQGIGMNDETSQRIFDQFYQGDVSRTGVGNGLGLPIVKRILDLCSGKITVKSQLGRGSIFIVYLACEHESL